MRVLVSGSNGLVGRALVPFLRAGGGGGGGGFQVRQLVRAGGDDDAVRWDPARDELDTAGLTGDGAPEVVVHLAGESIADGRWDAEKKARIRDSRVKGTRLLSRSLAGLPVRPRVLIAASAIGFYGNRGEDLLDEGSALGSGFLADVCREWEAAAGPAVDAGIRVVHLRLGVVVAPDGGVLKKMLPPFKLGVGGPIGGGKQWMSWIAREDLLEVILHVARKDDLRGPVNVVTPTPVTNREWSQVLGAVLHRPAFLPMPAFAARAVFGEELAEALLLSSSRVVPKKLLASGFTFRWPRLEEALRHLLAH